MVLRYGAWPSQVAEIAPQIDAARGLVLLDAVLEPVAPKGPCWRGRAVPERAVRALAAVAGSRERVFQELRPALAHVVRERPQAVQALAAP